MLVRPISLPALASAALIASWSGASYSATAAQTEATCAKLQASDAAARSEQWATALTAGRLDQLLSLYSSDSVLIVDGRADPIRDRADIRAFFQALALRHAAPRISAHKFGSGCGVALDAADMRFQVTGKRKGTRMFIGGRIATTYTYTGGKWLISEQRVPSMTIPNRAKP